MLTPVMAERSAVLFGVWWLDPAVALAVSAAAVQAGIDAWRGVNGDCC